MVGSLLGTKGQLTPRVMIHPAGSTPNPFGEFAGALGTFATVKEINDWIADLRDEPAA